MRFQPEGKELFSEQRQTSGSAISDEWPAVSCVGDVNDRLSLCTSRRLIGRAEARAFIGVISERPIYKPVLHFPRKVSTLGELAAQPRSR
jgi:hypothetical protein